MSSIIIHAALGPSNFERGSERWETKQLGYHKARKIMKITNFLLAPCLDSIISSSPSVRCTLQPSPASLQCPCCLSGQGESIADQLRRYTGELRQSRRGNDYQEHHDHRVLGSRVLFYQICLLSECGVCFVNFCTIKLNKRLHTTGCGRASDAEENNAWSIFNKSLNPEGLNWVRSIISCSNKMKEVGNY